MKKVKNFKEIEFIVSLQRTKTKERKIYYT